VPPIDVAGARRVVILAAASGRWRAPARRFRAFLGGLAADLSAGPLARSLAGLIPVAAIGTSDTASGPLGAQRRLPGRHREPGGRSPPRDPLIAGVAVGEPGLRIAAVVSGAIYNGVLAIAAYPLCRTLRRTTEKQASFGW
jgi:hypothetical protein